MDTTATERAHQDAWYARVAAERFFEREGFRRLISWNLERLRRVVAVRGASRVLSLGCGSGEYELALAAAGEHVVGIDLSPVAIDVARAQASARGLSNVEFRVGSLLDLELPRQAFDLVYAFGVLHHLQTQERAPLLRKAHEWLSPGGWFYARDPNARGLLRVTAGMCFRGSRFHSPNEESLDPRAIADELRRAGFADPRVGYTDVLAGPLPWIVSSRSRLLWSAVFAFDRAWLATPGLRQLASQFDVYAQR